MAIFFKHPLPLGYYGHFAFKGMDLTNFFRLRDWTLMPSPSHQLPSWSKVPIECSWCISSPSAFAQAVPSVLNAQHPPPVHHYPASSSSFSRPNSTLPCAGKSFLIPLIGISFFFLRVREKGSWSIQSPPISGPAHLPLSRGLLQLIALWERVWSTLDRWELMRCQRMGLQKGGSFFPQDQTFPGLWKHSTLSF